MWLGFEFVLVFIMKFLYGFQHPGFKVHIWTIDEITSGPSLPCHCIDEVDVFPHVVRQVHLPHALVDGHSGPVQLMMFHI